MDTPFSAYADSRHPRRVGIGIARYGASHLMIPT